MIKQRFLLLLILIMAITPVSFAFGYYSSMVGSLGTKSIFEQANSDSARHNSEHCLHHDKFKLSCHASGSCTFHSCADSITHTAYLHTPTYSSYRYGHTKKSNSRSLSFSPEIRPPITILLQS